MVLRLDCVSWDRRRRWMRRRWRMRLCICAARRGCPGARSLSMVGGRLYLENGIGRNDEDVVWRVPSWVVWLEGGVLLMHQLESETRCQEKFKKEFQCRNDYLQGLGNAMSLKIPGIQPSTRIYQLLTPIVIPFGNSSPTGRPQTNFSLNVVPLLCANFSSTSLYMSYAFISSIVNFSLSFSTL